MCVVQIHFLHRESASPTHETRFLMSVWFGNEPTPIGGLLEPAMHKHIQKRRGSQNEHASKISAPPRY